jgi:hypothetical protein
MQLATQNRLVEFNSLLIVNVISIQIPPHGPASTTLNGALLMGWGELRRFSWLEQIEEPKRKERPYDLVQVANG